jgi:hypothetical protein
MRPRARWLLLGLRFLLELALLAAVLVGAARTVGGALGWVVGCAAALAVAVLWGTVLSPRRRVDASFPSRVVAELALFGAAGALLAASGAVTAGVVLVLAEVVVLALLGGPDRGPVVTG